MDEKPKYLGNVDKYLSNLVKNIEREVLIGFQGLDNVMFKVLGDLVHSSSNYEEVKFEQITYPSKEITKEGKRHRYKQLYTKFEEEYFDIIIEKAIKKDAKIVLLEDTKYKGKIYINAYYFREGPAY